MFPFNKCFSFSFESFVFLFICIPRDLSGFPLAFFKLCVRESCVYICMRLFEEQISRRKFKNWGNQLSLEEVVFSQACSFCHVLLRDMSIVVWCTKTPQWINSGKTPVSSCFRLGRVGPRPQSLGWSSVSAPVHWAVSPERAHAPGARVCNRMQKLSYFTCCTMKECCLCEIWWAEVLIRRTLLNQRRCNHRLSFVVGIKLQSFGSVNR